MILGTLVPDGIVLRSIKASNPGFTEPICSSPVCRKKVEPFVQRNLNFQPGQPRCCAECVKQPRPALGLVASAWRGAPRSKVWRFCDRSGVSMQSEQLQGLGSSRGASIQHTAISLKLLKSQVYTTAQLCIPPANDILGLQFPNPRGKRSKKFHRNGFIACEATVQSDAQKGTVPDNGNEVEEEERGVDGSILTGDGSELRNTLRLVECAMLAATAGLAYFLSNLLRLEAYFGCFFPLPVVISSMRWGAAAGRKTVVATAMLLLILSGPLKAASYLLMHGFVGLAMGAFWKWELNWGLSIAGCTVVRCIGALGFVLLSSWLLRDNILALLSVNNVLEPVQITMNAHASVSYMLAALGINVVPTMPMIYLVFASLLVVNCGSFVFLLHVLYAIFLRRLGMNSNMSVPRWVERAM